MRNEDLCLIRKNGGKSIFLFPSEPNHKIGQLLTSIILCRAGNSRISVKFIQILTETKAKLYKRRDLWYGEYGPQK